MWVPSCHQLHLNSGQNQWPRPKRGVSRQQEEQQLFISKQDISLNTGSCSMFMRSESRRRFQQMCWRKCMFPRTEWQVNILLPHPVRSRPMTLTSSAFQLDLVTCPLSSGYYWIILSFSPALIAIFCLRHSGTKLEDSGVRAHFRENLLVSLSPQLV